MSTLPQNAQFLRESKLVVSKDLQGIDLSELRFTFRVTAQDNETPNNAEIRVYNLKDDTARQIIHEYDSVTLQAGYQNNSGVIFKGTVKQFRRGRERNVDSYLDILASDGDLGYNFGFVNQTLEGKVGPQEQLNAIAKGMGLTVDPNATQNTTGGILPRGKVLFGLGRSYNRQIAKTAGARWSIQNGKITIVPLSSYLPGQAVQINSATGMIGIPESTDNGITVKTLLNPQIKVGYSIQINNKDVNQTIVREQFFPSFTSAPTMVANVTADGFYRVIVVEHEGDTRGLEWYSDIICLSLDPSAKITNSVKAYG